MKYLHSLHRLRLQRPTPHGVGGLKYGDRGIPQFAWRPTPHGVGGLKLEECPPQKYSLSVPPRTGWVD